MFLFSLEIGIAQQHLYLDDNAEQISRIAMDSICNNQFYKCINFNTKAQSLKKAFKTYKFGRLEKEELVQLKEHLASNYNFSENIQRSLLIVYRDTLQNYERGTAENIDQVKNTTYKSSSLACKEKLSDKLLVNFMNLYGTSNMEPVANKTDYWKQDTGYIKELFFPYVDHYFRVLIRPNGDYLLFSDDISDKSIKKLIAMHLWYDVRKDLRNSIKANTPVGFFKKINKGKSSDACFY